jgi:hypothetical protein
VPQIIGHDGRRSRFGSPVFNLKFGSYSVVIINVPIIAGLQMVDKTKETTKANHSQSNRLGFAD